MKLKKFIEYTDALLPHEVMLLQSCAKFQDRERSSIFTIVMHNALSAQPKLFDERIDKRKYSHLMQWMQQRLSEYCTDTFYELLNRIDLKIKSDSIDTEEEQVLLKLIRDYTPHHFHFIRLYEVINAYLTYLLIRVRLNDYQMIHSFIHQYHDDYVRCKEVSGRLSQCASDIIRDYHDNRITPESERWNSWLQKQHRDQELDGYNRYQSLILLSYLSLMDEALLEKVLGFYDLAEENLKNGTYYSRKLLINFYGNKQLMLMKLNKHQLALYYGALSVKFKGPDHVMYLNNYCFNLMKLGRAAEALKLMKEALSYVKGMSNRFNRTIFISSMIKCYNENGMHDMAERYAENQLALYEKDILEHNWYKFFRSYFETLILQGKYSKLRRTIKKYQILELEQQFLNSFKSYAYFKWFYDLSQCKEGHLSERRFKDRIEKEKDRLRTTYGIEPSANVLKLIDHAIMALV